MLQPTSRRPPAKVTLTLTLTLTPTLTLTLTLTLTPTLTLTRRNEITELTPGGAAARSGLLRLGDRVVGVDGVALEGGLSAAPLAHAPLTLREVLRPAASHTLEVLRRGGDGAPSQTSALASLPRQGTVQSLTKFEQSGGLPTRLPPPSSADASPDQIPSGRSGSGRALSGGLGSGRSPAAARCGTCKVAPTVRASVRKPADSLLVPLTDCTEGVGLGLNRLALGAGLGAGLG